MQQAEKVLNDLLEGNKRFLAGKSIQSSKTSLKRLKDFAEVGQSPKAIILCCSDSRAPVEMIFDQDIGDLFVIRVAGNIVAPSIVGSVEFAASTFGVSLVLVMGHTKCGAVQATLDYIDNSSLISSENIHGIVSRIKPHIFALSRIPNMTVEDRLNLAVETNVRAAANQLSHSSRLIESLLLDKKLTIAEAVLDLNSGKVDFLAK